MDYQGRADRLDRITRSANGRNERTIGSLPDHLYPKQYTFEDKSQPFGAFLRDFEAMTRAHDWMPSTAARWLPFWLGADARARYNTLSDTMKQTTDYPLLIATLRNLFNPPESAAITLQTFNNTPRTKEETMEGFADRLEILLKQAEPTLDATARARFVINRLISAASKEVKLAFATMEHKPMTIRAFVQRAMAIEATANSVDTGKDSVGSKDGATNVALINETNDDRTAERERNTISDHTTRSTDTSWSIPCRGGSGTLNPLNNTEVPDEGCLGCGGPHLWRECDTFRRPGWLAPVRIRLLLQLAQAAKEDYANRRVNRNQLRLNNANYGDNDDGYAEDYDQYNLQDENVYNEDCDQYNSEGENVYEEDYYPYNSQDENEQCEFDDEYDQPTW